MPVRLVVRCLLLLSLVVVLAACGRSEAAPAVAPLPDDVGPVSDGATVAVLDNVFGPDELVVTVGTEVTWEWEGRAAHDVVGDGFQSELIVEGTFTHTFADEGAYAYVCTLHPQMTGTVYVVPEGSS